MELIPRPEHPDPQRMRENWRNLNGIWEFEMDPANSGFERGFVEKEHFSKEIFVPFVRKAGFPVLDTRILWRLFGIKSTLSFQKKSFEERFCCILVR